MILLAEAVAAIWVSWKSRLYNASEYGSAALCGCIMYPFDRFCMQLWLRLQHANDSEGSAANRLCVNCAQADTKSISEECHPLHDSSLYMKCKHELR